MRSVRKVVAAFGLAGLSVAASSAVAVPNELDAVAIAAQFPAMTVLEIVVPPELAGAPCTIVFGPEFGVGMPVGATVLLPGHNFVPVANLPGAGWYTAIGPFAPKGTNDDDNGYN